MRSLSQADNGTVAELAVGDDFEVVLPENVSTGYQWEVTGCDADLLELSGKSASYLEQEIGSGGMVTFTFRGRGAGTTRLSIEERRPWEKGDAALRRFQLDLVIRP